MFRVHIPWTVHRTNESILRELNICNRPPATCLANIRYFWIHCAKRWQQAREAEESSLNFPFNNLKIATKFGTVRKKCGVKV